MIGATEAVRLVATREVQIRIRGKVFAIVMVITAIAFVAFPIATKLINSNPKTPTVTLSRADAGFGVVLKQTADQLHQRLTVKTLADPAAGRAAVASGKADAYVEPGATGISATVKKSLSGELRTLFSVVNQQTALNHQITGLGGDPAKVATAVAAVQLHVHTQQKADPEQGQKLAVAIAAGVLMYTILMTVGQMVASGVVEEKSSRVVELLLATIKPWQLLAGKVLGIGVLGLLQMLIPGVLALAVAIGIGQLDISLANSLGTLVWSLGWFVAGFAVYAMLFAAVGALVSRQEDLGGVMMPVMMPLIGGWIVAISVLPSDPHNKYAEVLSFIPLLSPVLMPMRWALGVAPVWQELLALVLTLALGAVLLRFAGRIYRNSVLRSGARVPLRDALKAA